MSTDALITGLIGLVGIVLTYILSRGKEKADVTGTIANDNLSTGSGDDTITGGAGNDNIN